MVIRHYKKTREWFSHRRFSLLLFSTILVLVMPAFSGKGRLSEILFWATMTFLFIQSTKAADVKKGKQFWIRLVVAGLIFLTMLKPIGLDRPYIEVTKLILFSVFFIYIVAHLFRFVRKSKAVNMDVLITAINIYLLIGIISASLALLFYKIYPEAYVFPGHVTNPDFVTFLYYSFITMSTVGYGDITPRLPETQTLGYLIAITGQLYVAIIIAFLVGKLLVNADQRKG